MRISGSLEEFRNFLSARGADPEHCGPRDVLAFGFEFYETFRADDALPVSDEEFGDALLFEWGTRQALLPDYDECFYFCLTRQFTSVEGEDDDAMFQLHHMLEYPLTEALRSIGTDNRWCSSLEGMPSFKAFCLSHVSLDAVEGLKPKLAELTFSGV